MERVRAVAPQGVDTVFDAVGKDALPASVELRGGTTDRIITIADPGAADHGVTFSAGGTEPGEIVLAEHVRLAAGGRLSIPVAEVFPLEEAAKAHALSETGHVRGKLVIIPSQG